MLERLDGLEAESAWQWFIERYRPFVRSCLFRVLGNAQRADAASEEIWSYLFTSEVFQNADRSRRFRSFLAGVIRNYARDWQRRNHHAQAADEDATTPEPEALIDLPEDEEMRLFARQVLHLAMDELARTHTANARALQLFYGVPTSPDAEFDTPQPVSAIAEELDILPNATHQVLHKGRKRLRNLIENELRETVRVDGELEEELDLMLGAMHRDAPGLTG